MSPSLCRQAEGGRTAAVIASDLEKLGYKVWLDIYMKNISEDAMMEGVANSKATIALLSDLSSSKTEKWKLEETLEVQKTQSNLVVFWS